MEKQEKQAIQIQAAITIFFAAHATFNSIDLAKTMNAAFQGVLTAQQIEHLYFRGEGKLMDVLKWMNERQRAILILYIMRTPGVSIERVKRSYLEVYEDKPN